MRILVLVNTPAHAHLYRPPVREFQERGHEVLVLARDVGCTTALLEYHDLPFARYGAHDAATSIPTLAHTLTGQVGSIVSQVRAFEPDVVFGRGQYATVAGRVAGVPTVLVLDDEPSRINHAMASPFADLILSPTAMRRTLGPNHYTFEGVTECVYLHPTVFSPTQTVRETLELDAREPFALLRFNAHDALHDRGIRGFTGPQRRALIDQLADRVAVVVSDESESLDLTELPARPFDAHPAQIHDAIAAASLVVADTGTIVTESALIGTPALRYAGSDRHVYGEFESLAAAGLLEQYHRMPMLADRAREIVSDGGIHRRWQQRRDTFVESLPDVSSLIVAIAESGGTLPPARPEVRPARQRSAAD